MSKKSRQTNRSSPAQPPPWWWLTGGGAILLIITGLVLWWGSVNPAVPLPARAPSSQQTVTLTTPSSPAASPQQTNRGPRLSVDQTTVDEGKVKLGVSVRSSFRLSNTGTQPLQIQGEPQVELVEGCWPPRAVVSSTTLNPGDETQLTLDYMMHAGMDGPHEFRVHVRTNDPVEPEKVLIVKSNWVP